MQMHFGWWDGAFFAAQKNVAPLTIALELVNFKQVFRRCWTALVHLMLCVSM
jgi:hypothetical protein